MKTKAEGNQTTVTPDGASTSHSEQVQSPFEKSSEPQAEVEVRGGFTQPTVVQFQMVRHDVGIKIPCGVTEIEDVYAWADNWVATKLQEKMQEFVDDGMVILLKPKA